MQQLVIIDVGSNSIRLVLVRIGKNGNYKIVHDLKESVRLEKDMGPEQTIKPDRINSAIKTMQMFRNLCNALKPDKIIAVATEAVRRAANQQEFIKRIKTETGFSIRVLSGEEEAHYDYLGVIYSMDIENALMVDLGGGSTELIWMENSEVRNSISLPFGSINISQRYQLNDTIEDESMRDLQSMLNDSLSAIPWLAEQKHPLLIGVGGTFRNLGKIDRRRKSYPLELSHNYRMQADDVNHIHGEVSHRNLKQRRSVKGLSNDRADIIVGATSVISMLVEFCEVEEVVISGYGLREGIIYDYISRNHQPRKNALEYSLENNLWNYNLDQPHAQTIWKITAALYSQLQETGCLESNLEPIIRTAAMLHDAGIAINYYQQNEHLFYTLLNSEINGLSHRELIMSCYIAAFHRNIYNLALPRFKQLLDEDDVKSIRAVGVLLRIARSLDRSMSGLIQDVNCDIRSDKVIIRTVVNGNIDLEISDALRYCDEFKKAFRKDLFIL